MHRFLSLLALAAGLAACDAALSPYDGTDDGTGTTTGRMAGTWLYPDYAYAGTDDVFLDIRSSGYSYVDAVTQQRYAAAGCRESDPYAQRYTPLTDSTFTEASVYNGQPEPVGGTVGVRVSDIQLRFLRTFTDQNGAVVPYQNSLRRAPAAALSVPTCPFRTMGPFGAEALNSATLPQSYTATDSLGVLRTYRVSEAFLYVGVGYASVSVSQAIVTGSTTGPVRSEGGAGLRSVAAGGAWTADVPSRAMPGLRLSTAAASNSNVQTVRFQRAGMAAPVTLTFYQDFSRAAPSAALDALRRPQADPVSL